MVDRLIVRDEAESAAAQELAALGWAVTNLNELVGNCPFADLLACRAGVKVLVQVKGTTTTTGKFGTPPAGAHALAEFARLLSCRAVYAFVHFTDGEAVIRYARAAEVAQLAEADEAAHAGTNRYHVTIDQFAVEASGFRDLLCEAA